MVFTLLPRDTSFFDLFDQLAGKVLDAARALEEMLERWDRLEARVREMKDLEHECDAITHRTFDKLNLTFITPLEREDIHELTSRLDDIVDHIDSTASRLFIYGVKKPTDEAKLLAQVLTRTCIEVQKAVGGLRNLKDPVLRPRTRRGEDRQTIEKHPAYQEMERLAFGEFGLAALSHRGDVLGWPTPM